MAYHFREAVGSTATAALKDTEIAQPEDPGDCPIRVPVNIIDTVNKVVRTSRQMVPEIGREPTPDELAEKLGMPLDKVRKVLEIARQPIHLEELIGDRP